MAVNLSQGSLFLIFVLVGIVIGLLFDIFRILRRTFKTPDFVTYIEDILFWIISGILLIYSIFTFNNGEIRLFVLLGVAFGIILYILTISKYFVKYNVIILTGIKNAISYILKIILYPIKLIFKFLKFIFIKPINILRNLLTKIISKISTEVRKRFFFKEKVKKS